MEDWQIVALYWQRDPDAIARTAEKYGNYCGAVALRLLGDRRDAEECTNDTWLQAWRSIPPHRPDRLGAFLAQITRNLAFRRYKAAAAQKRGGGELPLVLDELEGCVPAGPGTAQAAEAAELERAMDRFLHRLPARDGNIFLRRYWYAEPLDEIAKRYGLPLSTVKSSLHRSRKKLKHDLETEGIFP